MKDAPESKPPTKGQRTRLRILERAAELFNVNGYANTAVTDVSTALGLEKGAVYNYFPAKDALALAAFDFNVAALQARIDEALDSASDPAQQLTALLDTYRAVPRNKGGCPLMNTAIEATDVHPELRSRARKAIARVVARLSQVLDSGVERGVFRPDIDVSGAAHAIFAGIEGAVMISRLFRDQNRMNAVLDQLAISIDALKTSGERR